MSLKKTHVTDTFSKNVKSTYSSTDNVLTTSTSILIMEMLDASWQLTLLMEIHEGRLALIWLNLTNLPSRESFKESNNKFTWSTIVGTEPDAVVTTIDKEGAIMAGGASPSKTSGFTKPGRSMIKIGASVRSKAVDSGLAYETDWLHAGIVNVGTFNATSLGRRVRPSLWDI